MPDFHEGLQNKSNTDMVLKEPQSYVENEVHWFSQWRKNFDGGRLRVPWK